MYIVPTAKMGASLLSFFSLQVSILTALSFSNWDSPGGSSNISTFVRFICSRLQNAFQTLVVEFRLGSRRTAYLALLFSDANGVL
ncbi:hypothetical protein B0H13DRAFT_2015930 [Mycena leptocephala]|nr:hypothetical protein B0H13DRAFT_2015930 [Mycena leptocephala]